ncbi:MAG: S41 family peptidase [Vicingaceae bacterium]
MKNNKILVLLPFIIAVVLAAGVYMGKQLAVPTTTLLFNGTDFGEENKLQQVLSYIKSDYVDTIKEQLIVEETINDMLQQLDPHSYYIPKRDYNQMNDPLEGNFEGIGVEFRIQQDTVVVIQPIGGGPSEKVGIRAGDRIVKVEGEDITGEKINNKRVVKLLKGPKGTTVNVKVKRRNEPQLIDFAIQRDEIPFYSVEASYMANSEVGYIKVIRFARTTHEEFMQAVEELEAKGMKKLILDLRNNSGGYMKSAIDMADEFLPKKQLIVYTKGKARSKQEFFATAGGELENKQVAILINEGSASASEILAGALQDNDRGFIIGRRSFGKGLVQEGIQWPDGSGIRLTVARYYTPTGRSIQKSYEEGLDNYNQETFERFESGELLSLDSIDLPDSLKFYTEKGKVLYGGGGILPDYFVPLDTNNASEYFGKLNYQGMFYQFGFNYVDDNRGSLKSNFTAEEFVKQYEVPAAVLNQFYEFASSKDILYNKEEAKESENLIKNRLKAAIGRNVWGDAVFYQVVNEQDKVMEKALKLLSKSETKKSS